MIDFKELRKENTLLGVGPVTRAVTRTAIKMANKYNVPLLLIPSRRQVETEKLGGGYVWTTEEFSKTVKAYDTKKKVLMARDHGGPFQGSNEEKVPEHEAYERCFAINTLFFVS